MKTINATKARDNLYNIIYETVETSEPIQITSKRGDVVLISVDDWNALQETIYLNSINGFKESLVDADNEIWISEEEVDW